MKEKQTSSNIQSIINRRGSPTEGNLKKIKNDLVGIKNDLNKGKHKGLADQCKSVYENYLRCSKGPNKRVIENKLLHLHHELNILGKKRK